MMRRTLLLVAALLCLALVVQAENQLDLDNGITVVEVVDDRPSPLSTFNPFSFFRHNESPFQRLFNRLSSLNSITESPMETLLQNLFRFPLFEIENEQPLISVKIQQSTAPSSDMFANTIHSFFNDFQQIINDLHTPLMDMSSQEDRVRVGCPLLRICADDIDNYCSVARLSQVVGAIEHCLQAHRQKLGDECRATLDSRAQPESSTPSAEAPITSGGESSSAESSVEMNTHNEASEVSTNSEAIVITPPTETPAETPAQPTPEVSKPSVAEQLLGKLPESCRPSAQTCVSSSIAASPVVNIMACLYLHKNDLPSDCMQSIETTPIFNCAVDVVKFCPQARGQANIVECLSHQPLSQTCLVSLRNVKNADPDFDPSELAATGKLPRFVQTDSAHASKAPVVAIGIGLIALLVVVVAVVVVRRRRRAERTPIVQLTNPVQVDIRQSL